MTNYFIFLFESWDARDLNRFLISRVSCQKGPTRHAYAWQVALWQDILDMH